MYAAGEVACVSINGANRLGSNSLPELLVFGARAGRAAAEYASEQEAPGRHLLAQALDEEARLQEQFLQQERRPGAASPTCAKRCRRSWNNAPAFTARANRWPERPANFSALQDRFRDIRLDDRGHLFNTELISALELSCMLDVAETMAECAKQRTESRGAHQRTDFPERNDEKFLAHSLVYRDADGRPRGGIRARDHHSLASRASAYTESEQASWRTGSRSKSRDIIPAQDEKPRFENYEVPLRKEWVVLDALNYIKDHLDGSLSFRWSCRMGVCGSCGMTVNGVPKLTCATFLSDYAPGPVRVEPMKNFPVLRDLVVDTSDFLVKLAKSKPWIIRDDGKALGRRVLPDPRAIGRL